MASAKIAMTLTAAAVALLAVPTGAIAADAAGSDSAAEAAPAAESGVAAGGLQEIVVTAQKREERLFDVPVAVTAVTSEALTTQNLVRMSDIYSSVPGLQYSGGASGRVYNLSLRGITSGGNANPTLAILIDDVPFGGATNAGQPPIPDFDPATIDRLEVLRGPQGTLYGAASLGGLIKYVTHTPSTTDFSGRLELGSNTVDGGGAGYSARGSVNIPLLADRVGLSVSGFYRDDPAYIDNIFPTATASNVNTRKLSGGRGALLLHPTDDLTITLSALGQKVTSRNSDLSFSSGGILVCPPCQAPGNTATTTFTPVYDNLTTIKVVPATGTATFDLYTVRLEYDLHWAQLTSISGYGESDNQLNNDVTAVFGRLLVPAYAAPTGSTVVIANADHTHKFTQEIRLGAKGKQLDWLAGVFYDLEHATTDQTLTLGDPTGKQLAVPYIGSGPSTYKEYAGFADLTYHATDRLDVQVGGRYAKNKQVSTSQLNIDGPAQPIFGPTGSISAPSEEGSSTWLFTPSYHLTPDLLTYFRLATGYRPGGPNTGVPNVDKTFGSDSVINYELGFKGFVIPRQLSLDLSVFEIDWKDIQLQDTDAVSQLTFLTNGGKARSRGIETALQWSPWSGFTIDSSATYTDAVLTEDLPALANATALSGKSGDRLPFTARFTGNLSAQQTFVLTDRLDAFVGATYTYIGERLSAFKTNGPAASRPRFSLPGYSLFDLRAGFDYDKHWHLDVYARNVANKFGVIAATNRNGTAAPDAVFTQPRTLGLTASYDF
jgi:outer membrane receptor protein involved in Fe transport